MIKLPNLSLDHPTIISDAMQFQHLLEREQLQDEIDGLKRKVENLELEIKKTKLQQTQTTGLCTKKSEALGYK